MTVINKLELIHFGKFKDTTIELENGKNILSHQNEWGKSTVCDFIIYVLYGFKKTAKKSILLADNFLKKYLPWTDDSHIQGALELTSNGKKYRIERKTLASGRMSLTVLDASGGALDVLEPGEYFFGVDAKTFMRTFLVRQTDIAFDGTDAIETALKNLVTTGDEETSFDSALKVITDKKSNYQHGDMRRGRVFDIPKQITENKLKISALMSKVQSLDARLFEFDSLNAALLECQQKQAELEAKKQACEGNDALALVKRAEAVIADIELYKQKQAAADTVITDAEAKAVTDSFNKLEVLRASKNDAKARFENASTELENAKSGLLGIEYVAENTQKITEHLAKKPMVNIPVIVIGIGITVMAVAAPFLAILGALLIVLGIVIKIKPKPILNKTNEQLKADLERFYAVQNDITQASAKQTSAKQEFEVAKARLDDILPSIDIIKTRYGIDTIDGLSSLLAQSKNADMIGEHIIRLQTELDSILLGKTLEHYKELSKNADGGIGTKQLNEQIMANANQKSRITMDIASLEPVRIEKERTEAEAQALNTQVLSLEAELEDALYNNKVLEIARDTLKEAYDKINNTYSPIISQKIAPYIDTLTGSKYSEILIDREFNIRVKYKGEYKELGYFSRGTADSIYFAVRVAMAEILEGENKLPLILDDPFWSLDGERKANADALLDRLCKDRQVIVFNAN